MAERLVSEGVLMEKRKFVTAKGKDVYVAKVGWMGGGRELFVSAEVFETLPDEGTEVQLISRFSEGFDGKPRLDDTAVLEATGREARPRARAGS